MMRDEFMKSLRPVKRRLRQNRFLRGAAAGLAAGLGAAVLTQAAAFFIPVQDRALWAAAAAAAVTVLTAVGNALRPVRNTEAAKAADACGLKERAITALEEGDEPIRRLQRRDACRALEGLDVRMIRPGSVRKGLFAALGCAVLLACLVLVPSPQDRTAEARKALTKTLKEGRETIASAAEEDEKDLSEKRKSELRKITEELNRELDESRDAADAMVALDRAEQRLEEFRQKTAGDAAAADQAAGGKESRAEESKDQGAGAGENGSQGSGSQTMSGQAQASVAGAALTDAQMNLLQALAGLKAAVNPSAGTGTYMQAVAGMQGVNGSQGAGAAAGTGGAANNGKSGGGAGEGSTNEEESGGSSSGVHVQGSRDPKYKEEQYETIYDPEHIDKAKQDAATDQNRLSDEDSLQLETGPGRGSLSGDVPWGEALQDYADTEARAADRENLTIQERQWVDEYYRLLTEQK